MRLEERGMRLPRVNRPRVLDLRKISGTKILLAALTIINSLAEPGNAKIEPTTSSATLSQDCVKIEKVADGLVFPEGPVWHPDGFLLFSDVQGGKIMKLDAVGGCEPWINFDPPRQTNGLMLSNDRTKIYAGGHGELALLEIDAHSKATRIVTRECSGLPYNDVNDVATDSAGHVFFTDPKWGKKAATPQGVYRVNPADGTTTLAAALDRMPNGITISPDQRWLYVDRTGGDDVWRYRLSAEGTLTDGARWIALDAKSGPDGMSIDRQGNLYICQAGNGCVQVVSAEGKILRSVKVFERMCTNCEFEHAGPGGIGDGRVLYVTGGGLANQKVGAVYRLTFPQ